MNPSSSNGRSLPPPFLRYSGAIPVGVPSTGIPQENASNMGYGLPSTKEAKITNPISLYICSTARKLTDSLFTN